MNLEEPLKGQGYHREALSIFQASSDQHGLAETLDYLGVASLTSVGKPCRVIRIVDHVFSLWYHHVVLLSLALTNPRRHFGKEV